MKLDQENQDALAALEQAAISAGIKMGIAALPYLVKGVTALIARMAAGAPAMSAVDFALGVGKDIVDGIEDDPANASLTGDQKWEAAVASMRGYADRTHLSQIDLDTVLQSMVSARRSTNTGV
jgi:hypothetical protein